MDRDEFDGDLKNPSDWRGYVIATLKTLLKKSDRLEDKYDKHCETQEIRFDEVESLIKQKMGVCPYRDDIIDNAKEIKGLKGSIFYWYLLVGLFIALTITALVNTFRGN